MAEYIYSADPIGKGEYSHTLVGELVRCGECVHCADDFNGNQPMFSCELSRCGESVQPNDFCSYGERRADDDEK